MRAAIRRVEHALLAAALAAVLAWLVDTGATDLWRVLVWAIAPDIVFVPIALAARGRAWPAWGAPLYNATHTYVVMLPSFALASWFAGHLVLPLLAWAAHIELDRALGFDLR